MALLDRCIWRATSSGTGDFVEAGAISGYQTMEVAGAADGQVYGYAAQSNDSLQWEVGRGIWTLSTQTFARTQVYKNSAGGAAPLSFSAAPQIMITALAENLINLTNLNLDFYVATTGSDLNPGTLASPFATITWATVIAGRYDYQGQFSATIHVAAGTYNISGGLNLGALTNGGGTVAGAAYNTTILHDQTGDGLFNGAGWTIRDVTMDSNQFAIRAVFGEKFTVLGTVAVTDTTNSGTAFFFSVSNGGYINIDGGSVTVIVGAHLFSAFISTYFTPGGGGTVRFHNCNVTLDAGFTYSSGTWLFGANYSGQFTVIWSGVTITNKAQFTSIRFDCSGSKCFLVVDNGLSDLPGSSDVLDNAQEIILLNQNTTSTMGNNATPLSATTVVPGGFSLLKEVSTARRLIAYNDAGTVYTRQVGNFINTQTVSYTLTLADAEGVVETNTASANNVTVPPNSSVAFPLGTKISVSQEGAGLTTIVAGAGVTIRNVAALAGQYKTCVLFKRGTDEWIQTNGAF